MLFIKIYLLNIEKNNSNTGCSFILFNFFKLSKYLKSFGIYIQHTKAELCETKYIVM